MDKVSIIIPVHNSSKYIYDCIYSVINQTYEKLEIIVVDDKSEDNSIDIIKGIKDKRIKIIKLKKNMGVAEARNIGIKKASGKYICFIDSDDYWYPEKIEKQIEFISKNNCEFIYGSYYYLRDGRITHKAKVPKKITYKQALKNTTIFTSTVMFNMKKLKKKDIFMPNVRLGQDTLCWWKVLKLGITAYGMEEALVVYRVGNKSLSSNKLKALKRTWNLYKLEDISYVRKVYCFICYMFNAVKRRIF